MSAGTLSVNMRQFRERWRWNADTAHYGDNIVRAKGKLLTLNTRPYIELLTEFNIFFTTRSNPAKRNPAKRNPDMDNDAVRELENWVGNDRDAYPQILSIVANVQRKLKRGTYDHEKAIKLWRYGVDSAAKNYAREFASPSDWSKVFPVSVRNEVARRVRDTYLEMIQDGQFDPPGRNPAPRKKRVKCPELVDAVMEALPDLKHYAATHGPGPDRRLDAVRAALTKETGVQVNPASRKKPVSKKKASTRKKAPARKKVAVGARSRITGEKPSKRLRSRRAKNLRGPSGYFPNPARKKSRYLVVTLSDRNDPYYFNGVDRGVRYRGGDEKYYASRAAALAAARSLTARGKITRPLFVVSEDMTEQAIIDYARGYSPGKK